MKKFLPLLILLAVAAAGIFFYSQNRQIEKPSVKGLTKVRPLVSTDGWKEYSMDMFSIKYPPNYIVNDQHYLGTYSQLTEADANVVTITEEPDEAILSGDAYIPGAWAGVEIFSPVEFVCFGTWTCEAENKKVINQLDFLPTEWKEMLLQLDGHSPTEAGTSQITLSGKQAVHQWFFNASGIEGPPLSESNLYIKIDDTHILPIRGVVRDTDEKNLAIIETIYSTIVFHE